MPAASAATNVAEAREQGPEYYESGSEEVPWGGGLERDEEFKLGTLQELHDFSKMSHQSDRSVRHLMLTNQAAEMQVGANLFLYF